MTKSGNKRRRRSLSLDREILRKRRAWPRVGAGSADDPAVENSPPAPPRPANDDIEGNSGLAKGGRDARQRKCPHWAYASEPLKIHSLNRGIERFGKPFAFTINLDGKTILAAQLDRDRGFTPHVHDKLRRALKRQLGTVPEFWIKLEVSPNGKPHVHGGIAANDNMLASIFDALRSLGRQVDMPGRQKPVHCKSQFAPDGWSHYCAKDIMRARGFARGAIVCSSRLLSKEARRLHEELRAEWGEREGTQECVRAASRLMPALSREVDKVVVAQLSTVDLTTSSAGQRKRETRGFSASPDVRTSLGPNRSTPNKSGTAFLVEGISMCQRRSSKETYWKAGASPVPLALGRAYPNPGPSSLILLERRKRPLQQLFHRDAARRRRELELPMKCLADLEVEVHDGVFILHRGVERNRQAPRHGEVCLEHLLQERARIDSDGDSERNRGIDLNAGFARRPHANEIGPLVTNLVRNLFNGSPRSRRFKLPTKHARGFGISPGLS